MDSSSLLLKTLDSLWQMIALRPWARRVTTVSTQAYKTMKQTYHVGDHEGKVVWVCPSTSFNCHCNMGKWHIIISHTDLLRKENPAYKTRFA